MVNNDANKEEYFITQVKTIPYAFLRRICKSFNVSFKTIERHTNSPEEAVLRNV